MTASIGGSTPIFDHDPDAVELAALKALVPSAWEAAPVVERLADEIG